MIMREDRYRRRGRVDSGMRQFRVTIRYGGSRQRYHTLDVEAADAAEALRRVADEISGPVAQETDLVELRVAVDPDARQYTPDGP